MKNLGYYNGTIGLIEEMQVPMLDRAGYFGDGVYDATVSRNHTIYALEEHLDRFYEGLDFLRIEPPMPRKELGELLAALVRKVDDGEQFVYWQASRGAAMRRHAFPHGVKASLWIMLFPYRLHDDSIPEAVVTAEDTRFLHCNIKTINLIPGVLASQKAAEADCFEAVFHRDGRVTECARSNVHILQDGVLRTAPADHLILNGIARRHLLAACGELGIPTREEPYTLAQLLAADEVLITNSGVLCARVSTVDGAAVGGRAGTLVARLQEHLHRRFAEATAP